MKKRLFLFVAVASVGLGACSTTNNQSTASTDQSTSASSGQSTSTSTTTTTTAGAGTATTSASTETNGLKLYPLTGSPNFPNAQLHVMEPAANGKVAAGDVKFEYHLADYQLTAQTEGSAHEDHANSAQGQHIHNIVDNEPYTAHYTTSFTKPIKEGSHVVLSFLSRSYHESLKHKTAYDLRIVNVGAGTTGPGANFNTKGQHLFYSRPKGDYVGNDTKKVMLDFYLVNTDLSNNGNKVRATINGTPFTIDKWQPYTIEGLPMGESTIKLELLDKNGQVIPGPFNTVERKITLKAS